jgi:anti-sigma factor ChrR (cupin superfamily)
MATSGHQRAARSDFLIVPMCLAASIVGVVLREHDNNTLAQGGFVVLIALAARDATNDSAVWRAPSPGGMQQPRVTYRLLILNPRRASVPRHR